VWQVAKRSFWILVINYALRLLPDFKNLTHIRFYGVLPRIAVVYFFASLIYLAMPRARDLAITCGIALVSYYVLLRWVSIPGVGMPGHDVPFMDQYNNLTAYIDRGFYHWTVKYLHTGSLYNKYRDPEGLLSTLPSIGTSLLGILAGKLLRSKESAKKVRNTLGLCGIAGIVLGLIWNSCSASCDLLSDLRCRTMAASLADGPETLLAMDCFRLKRHCGLCAFRPLWQGYEFHPDSRWGSNDTPFWLVVPTWLCTLGIDSEHITGLRHLLRCALLYPCMASMAEGNLSACLSVATENVLN
jgi:hypothetical protein